MTSSIPLTDDGYLIMPHLDCKFITTSSVEARKWFNRGLAWSYAFNHIESAACFEKAVQADRTCAIAHWGLAYAHGPNYNKSWGLFSKADIQKTIELSRGNLNTAQSLAAGASPAERGLIEALQHRYPKDNNPNGDVGDWNVAYADAMKPVYAAFGDDLDVAALYADALMNLAPWHLWNIWTGEPNPNSRTIEAKDVIERAVTQPGGRDHIGLLHMYIHLMEMSTTPEKAMPLANRLRRLAASAGHLAHMPSHLDALLGDYEASINANAVACEVNEQFVAFTGRNSDFYTIYRMHDYHSLIYAAMLSGRFEPAMDAVERMEANITEDLLRIESMADWTETFVSVRVHVLIRFGRWKDLLDLKIPRDQDLYCVTTAIMHYGKGVAWAAIGNIEEAVRERELFVASKKNVPPTRYDFPNKCIDILEVAHAMLDGEIEYRRGNFDAAFTLLRRSVDLDDNLVYSEPWPWMQPARHAYAALLLEQGRVEEAAAAYEADLGYSDALPRARQHPNNIWALHGYHECLMKLGRTAEARIIAPMLKTAQALADVEVTSSCYCRRPEVREGECSQGLKCRLV